MNDRIKIISTNLKLAIQQAIQNKESLHSKNKASYTSIQYREGLTRALKSTSVPYKMGKDHRRNHPDDWRLSKALKKVRPFLSVHDYSNFMKALSQASLTEREKIVTSIEKIKS
tara:strand:+ start:10594 stop:10935 length:342 start_codon:yes stop_codon:yes gene_type:complete